MLNAKAEMLQRLDNKYVVESTVVRQAIVHFARHFDVLEIGGRRAFTYETCYFDDAELHSYFDHHRGRRKRAKVRTRRYVDAGLCFLEVKLKHARGQTIKRRMPYDAGKYGMLDETAWAHIRESYRLLYGRDFPHDLFPALEMRYRRMTLVAKDGGERLTIDNGLHFHRQGRAIPVDDDLFIIEAKSANGNGIADRVLRRLHQHPTSHCSKYCTGMALMQAGMKHNKFRPVLKKLGFPASGFMVPPTEMGRVTRAA